jgi:hypothetical protein
MKNNTKKPLDGCNCEGLQIYTKEKQAKSEYEVQHGGHQAQK